MIPSVENLSRVFLDYAFNAPGSFSIRNGKKYILCPCRRCDNTIVHEREEVSKHLLGGGFCSGYESWYHHGEPHVIEVDHATSPTNDAANLMSDMLHNIADPEFDWDNCDVEEPPNALAKDFFDMSVAAKQPLREIELSEETRKTCEKHLVLSAISECLALKSEFHMSEICFDRIVSLMKTMLPEKERLPGNFYQAKKLVRGLGMGYQKINICPNNCMLYYKGENKLKDKCNVCGEPRYKTPNANCKGKSVPQKVLRYLPIGPRLQRLYMMTTIAIQMRWHAEGLREKSGIMVHPSDAKEWKNFNQKHPEFARDIRNVCIGVSTDGFAPYSSNVAPYTCWPVFIFPYNLPFDLVMKE